MSVRKEGSRFVDWIRSVWRRWRGRGHGFAALTVVRPWAGPGHWQMRDEVVRWRWCSASARSISGGIHLKSYSHTIQLDPHRFFFGKWTKRSATVIELIDTSGWAASYIGDGLICLIKNPRCPTYAGSYLLLSVRLLRSQPCGRVYVCCWLLERYQESFCPKSCKDWSWRIRCFDRFDRKVHNWRVFCWMRWIRLDFWR